MQRERDNHNIHVDAKSMKIACIGMYESLMSLKIETTGSLIGPNDPILSGQNIQNLRLISDFVTKIFNELPDAAFVNKKIISLRVKIWLRIEQCEVEKLIKSVKNFDESGEKPDENDWLKDCSDDLELFLSEMQLLALNEIIEPTSIKLIQVFECSAKKRMEITSELNKNIEIKSADLAQMNRLLHTKLKQPVAAGAEELSHQVKSKMADDTVDTRSKLLLMTLLREDQLYETYLNALQISTGFYSVLKESEQKTYVDLVNLMALRFNKHFDDLVSINKNINANIKHNLDNNPTPLWMIRLLDIECGNTNKYGESANRFRKDILLKFINRVVYLVPQLKFSVQALELWNLSKSEKSDYLYQQKVYKLIDFKAIIMSVVPCMLEHALQKIVKPKYVPIIMRNLFTADQIDASKQQDITEGDLKNLLSQSFGLLNWAREISAGNPKNTDATTQEVTETGGTPQNGDDESKGEDRVKKC